MDYDVSSFKATTRSFRLPYGRRVRACVYQFHTHDCVFEVVVYGDLKWYTENASMCRKLRVHCAIENHFNINE